ncbi:hypothetical protein [Candidatus Coxiella mudrowiae]|uniref:hypothetical protein n=1 Tax=Candidatus Coxiella mudrowiae TaxID=2054173 RepID=UPI000C28668F|nr:hypothetical protein [Candidatus Coxiella mudrowiae]
MTVNINKPNRQGEEEILIQCIIKRRVFLNTGKLGHFNKQDYLTISLEEKKCNYNLIRKKALPEQIELLYSRASLSR